MKTPLKSELLSSSSMVFLSKRKNRKIRLIAVLDMEKIKEYVESQRTDDHKRKYEKTGRYKKK